MQIAEQLETALKEAMRAKDKAVISCIRQIKAKAQEAENAAGFSGNKDDAFFQDVIARYSKMLSKSLGELKSGGERGVELARSYQAELDYLARYLPKALSDSDLSKAAHALVAEGQLVAKDIGRAMGQLMTKFKGQIEPGRARQALSDALAKIGGAGGAS